MDVLPSTPAALKKALSVLSRGGIVAHATETCYGLACDASNQNAVSRLFLIKQRPESLPVSALFPSVEDAKRYVEWTEEAERLAKLHLPGPLTLILRLRADAPAKLFPTPLWGETIGVRVSSHPFASSLVRTFGKPLTTTSANVHGARNPYDAEEILGQFADGPMPDLVIDSGVLKDTPPSTVIDLSGNAKIVKRQGDVKRPS